MNYNYKNGNMLREDYNKIYEAQKFLNKLDLVSVPSVTGGQIIDGKDYARVFPLFGEEDLRNIIDNIHNAVDVIEKYLDDLSMASLTTSISLKAYSEKFGVKGVRNTYGEHSKTTENHIIFPNGWVASIVDNDKPEKNAKYSVAMCDYTGFFDWSILNQYGAEDGCFYCNTIEEVINACEIIRKLEPKKIWFI